MPQSKVVAEFVSVYPERVDAVAPGPSPPDIGETCPTAPDRRHNVVAIRIVIHVIACGGGRGVGKRSYSGEVTASGRCRASVEPIPTAVGDGDVQQLLPVRNLLVVRRHLGLKFSVDRGNSEGVACG